jgi:hypothetical protein
MTSLVSLVLNNADRLPIVGSPIGQATSWYNRRNSQEEATTLYDESNILPPPPYEKVPSRLTKISDYVWKRASFSSAVEINPTNKLTPNNNQLKMEPLVHIIDKKHIQDGLTLINIATEMNHSYTQHQQQMSLELYMMGLDKILSSLPSKCRFIGHIL